MKLLLPSISPAIRRMRGRELKKIACSLASQYSVHLTILTDTNSVHNYEFLISGTYGFTGVPYEGTADDKFTWTYEEINGIKIYVATPEVDFPKDKAMIYLTDVFGLEFPNNLLLEGDLVAPDAFSSGTFDYPLWVTKHTPEHTGKRVLQLIEGLRGQSIIILGATGYCYGARLTLDLAFEHIIQAAVVAHPSLIWICEDDEMFLKFAGEAAGKKFAPGYRRTYYECVSHGFAVRGEIRKPVVKAAKEDAFKESVEWLIKYLQ